MNAKPKSPKQPPGTYTPRFILPQVNPKAAAPFNDAEATHRFVSAIARQSLEVLNGFRPANSLQKFVNYDQCQKLSRRAQLLKQFRERKQIKAQNRVTNGNVRVCYLGEDRLEVNTTVRDTLKTRFVVMRWENRGHTGWKVTFLELG